jgi:hypothetical protein
MFGAFYFGQTYFGDTTPNSSSGGLTSIIVGNGSYILSFTQLQRLKITPTYLSVKQDLTEIWNRS